MALKNCRECGSEVSSKATKCPQCGYPLKKKRRSGSGGGCLIFIIFIVIIIIYENNKTEDIPIPVNNNIKSNQKIVKTKKYSPKNRLNPSQIELLNNLEKKDLIKIRVDLIKVEVNPEFWERMKYVTKEDFAAVCAVRIGNLRKNNLYWCNIYDMYSGKKLAYYSTVWGFKTY